MTVSTLTVRNTYAANGVTTQFAYTFRVIRREDLVVSRVVDATGVETVLAIDTDYTVTGIGSQSGGTVTLIGTPVAAGHTILLRRLLAYDQPTDYANQGRFFPETHERSFDRATMQIQQLSDGLARAILQPSSGLPWYDAQGNRIINVGDAQDAQDAVNQRTMENYVSLVIGAIGGYVVPQVWTFTGDATQLAFAIPGAEVSEASAYEVAIDGLLQAPGTDYTIQLGAETVTFDVAPPSGAFILVRARGYAEPLTPDDWNANGTTIINVGAPVNPGDAVNLQYLLDLIDDYALAGHTHVASDITSGIMDPARLAAGVRDGTKFLRDDGVWVSPSLLPLPYSARGDIGVWNGSALAALTVGSNGYTLVADSSETLGVRWAPAVNAAAVAGVLASQFTDSSTVAFAVDLGVSITADIVAGSIGTTQLADDGVTAAKIADGAVGTDQVAALAITAAKIANGTVTLTQADTSSFDTRYAQIGDAMTPAAHTHGAADIVSGILAPERMGSGYGGIPDADRPNYVLNAAGTWTALEALYDGAVVATGSGGSGGGGAFNNEAAQDAVGSIFANSARIAPTYNDGVPSMSWDIVAGSIGLTQVDTASLDTRYALVGSGSLPPGGTTGTFIRGPSSAPTWSNSLDGPDGLFITSGGLQVSQFTGTAFSSRYGALVEGRKSVDSGALSAQPLVSRFVAGTDFAGFVREARMEVYAADGIPSNRYARMRATAGSYFFDVGASGSTVASEFWGNATINGDLSVTGIIAGTYAGSIAAAQITSGVISSARLGSGTANSGTYLRGDGAWAAIPSAGSITVGDTATIDLALDGGNNLTAALIDASVTTGKIATGAVITAKIADANVTTAKIADGNVTTAKVADGNITTAKIAAGAVGATQIANSAVTELKIANGAVTPAKMYASAGVPSSSTYYRGDGTWQTISPPTSQFYNVKSYGATGNGITNDGTAIQTAINAAAAAGGGTVYFPAGTYRVTTSIAIGNRVTLLGDGTQASVIDARTGFDTSGTVFAAVNHDSAAVKAMRIRFTPTDTGAYTYGVLFFGCTYAVAEDVEVDGIFGAGISFNACDWAWATRCNCRNGGTDSLGYFVTDMVELATFTDCHASYNGLGGLIGGDNVRVQGGIWHHNGIDETGPALGGASLYFAKGSAGSEIPVTNVTIDGVTAHHDTEEAIQMFGIGCSITNCISYENDGGGIALFGSSDCVIAGNVCFNNGNIRATGTDYGGVSQPPWFWAGIKMIDCENVALSGNRCYDDRVTKYQSYGVGCAPAVPYYFGGSTSVCNNLRLAGNLLTGNESGEVIAGSATNFNTTTY